MNLRNMACHIRTNTSQMSIERVKWRDEPDEDKLKEKKLSLKSVLCKNE